MLSAGVAAALGAALLFGAGTPLAKLLLGSVGPWMLAGLFYLGSGLGLTLYRLATRAAPVKLASGEAVWLAGATLAARNTSRLRLGTSSRLVKATPCV